MHTLAYVYVLAQLYLTIATDLNDPLGIKSASQQNSILRNSYKDANPANPAFIPQAYIVPDNEGRYCDDESNSEERSWQENDQNDVEGCREKNGEKKIQYEQIPFLNALVRLNETKRESIYCHCITY